LQDGGEIDLKLLGEALSGENEVIEVEHDALITVVGPITVSVVCILLKKHGNKKYLCTILTLHDEMSSLVFELSKCPTLALNFCGTNALHVHMSYL